MIKIDRKIVAARARHAPQPVTSLSSWLLRRDVREYTINDVEHALEWTVEDGERDPAANDAAVNA